jgi:hypothetical protein
MEDLQGYAGTFSVRADFSVGSQAGDNELRFQDVKENNFIF